MRTHFGSLMFNPRSFLSSAFMLGVLPVLLLTLLTDTCRAETIPLILQNDSQSLRQNWPLSSGVPIPQSVLRDEKLVRLRDENNRELPLQTRALSRWEDGSIKWLLLDFQSNIAPPKTVIYSLETGAATSAKSDSPLDLLHNCRNIAVVIARSLLKISENAERIFVDTGALRFTVSKKRMGLLASAQIKKTQNGKTIWQEMIQPNSDDVFASLEHNSPGEPRE